MRSSPSPAALDAPGAPMAQRARPTRPTTACPTMPERLDQLVHTPEVSAARARIALAAILITAMTFVGISLSPLASGNVGKQRPGEGDIALFTAHLARVHRGEGYYDAAGAEMQARGYPTRSVFNWRTPFPIALLGRLPEPRIGRVLLGLLAVALLLAGFEAMARQGTGLGVAALCGLLLTGPLMFCVLGDLYVSPCLWSGVWIGLSLAAYGLNRPGWGIGMGLAALFFRELALPYCLVASALAASGRHWRQVWAWGLGLLGWVAFLVMHWLAVSARITPDALAHPHGWIQFAGAPLVIAMAQVNAYLLLMPQWVAALYLVGAMVGFAGWNSDFGRRTGLTAAVYVVAFGCVGQEFNQYWGAMIAPLLCFGAARCPLTLAALWHQAQFRWTRRWSTIEPPGY